MTFLTRRRREFTIGIGNQQNKQVHKKLIRNSPLNIVLSIINEKSVC